MRNERHRLSVEGIDVHVEAPKPVMQCLTRMLERADSGGRSPSSTQFVVEHDHTHATAADAAEAVIDEMADYVSAQINARVVRGAVVRRNDVTLVLLGETETSTLVAAHLTARGWSLLSPRHAFFTMSTMEIIPFPTLMRVKATAIDRYPKAYRRAFEMSAWCSTEKTLDFYAVDPAKARPAVTWGKRARLVGLVVIDSDMQAQAEITDLTDDELDPLFGAEKTAPGVRRARLTLGPLVLTATLLERWAEAAS